MQLLDERLEPREEPGQPAQPVVSVTHVVEAEDQRVHDAAQRRPALRGEPAVADERDEEPGAAGGEEQLRQVLPEQGLAAPHHQLRHAGAPGLRVEPAHGRGAELLSSGPPVSSGSLAASARRWRRPPP